MEIFLKSYHSGSCEEDSQESLHNAGGIYLDGEANHSWKGSNGANYYCFGELIGIRDQDSHELSQQTFSAAQEFLKDPQKVSQVEGRFVIVKITADSDCHIWTDQFGRIDVYWQTIKGRTVVSTEMECLPVVKEGSGINDIGIAHALVVYGSRPAKRDTLYKDVHRLGVGEVLKLNKGTVTIGRPTFHAAPISEYGENKLHEYTEIFIESVRARGSEQGNVVFLSSGWDSTSILAALVHCFGNKKVRGVIGRMRYSERRGIINQFEIDRAAAFAEFYDIPLDICELDYRTDAREILDEVTPLFRSQQFSNLTGLNHWKLAKHAARTANADEVVFAGEISDGAHNLGFSQYMSIFHPSSIDFREYSDKMASHLFGPTFLRDILSGSHEANPVWQIYRNRSEGITFDEPKNEPESLVRQFLASFFLRAGRLPFYSLTNSRFLTKHGAQEYSHSMEEKYLRKAASEANPENLYSWYLHLYHSFHWQGATVATLEHTLEAHQLRCALPFIDSHMLQFLSQMPESWGRGLDLKPTKYPLKWMLQHRIKYPMELQTGPHSYLYDVDPSFNHLGEIMFGSSFVPIFKDVLKGGHYQKWLAEDYFSHEYIDSIVRRYLSGEEFGGSQLNDLGALAMFSAIGVYES